ncbi:MAG: amino acid racemase [Eggerthellaceae bacterium]|nr:amino acid racemase [Eggerthellaceae bacterium]
MSSTKKLGIIGGVGPAATAHLFSRIVGLTHASSDQEHIDITILNRPSIPDRTAYILGKSDLSYIPAVQAAVKDLEKAGCEVVCMPCVTGHAAFDECFSDSNTAVVHMLNETANFLVKHGAQKVGILATDGTAQAGVLQAALNLAGLTPIFPDNANQKKVMSIIYDYVKAGKKPDMTLFYDVCEHFASQGCDSIILGCTELSLIGAPKTIFKMQVVDALEVLAQNCVVACGAQLKQFE